MVVNKKIVLTITLFIFGIYNNLYSLLEQSRDNFHTIIVRGMGDAGSGFWRNNLATTYDMVLTNRPGIDMGQRNCIRHLEEGLQLITVEGKKRIFIAISQGSATLLNWLGSMTHEEQEAAASFIILEGALGETNKAIVYAIQQTSYHLSSYLPFSRSCCPWLAKLYFPYYQPYGLKSTNSVRTLSPNIPVILLHNRFDRQTSIDGSRELYCVLRQSGHENVYLVEVEGGNHVNVLYGCNDSEAMFNVIKALCAHHQIPAFNGIVNPIDRSLYQPTIQEVNHRIWLNSGNKQKIHTMIDMVAALVCAYLINEKYHIVSRLFQGLSTAIRFF